MATGDTVLSDDSLIRRPEGLGIALTVPWYRSLWLSSVSDIAVSVEGREIPKDDLRVELGERTYRVDELADQWDVLWFIQDRLVVLVPHGATPLGEAPAEGQQVDVEVTVDLREKTVRANEFTAPFRVDDYTRWRLLEGLDDIALTLRNAESIAEFERNRPQWMPATTPAPTA